MKMASKMFCKYIRDMQADFVAVPVEGDCLKVAIVAPDMIVKCIEDSARVIERRKGERYARMKRVYTATIVCPLWRPVALIDTPYKRFKDVPTHCGMRSRGWEVVVADVTHGTHKGDNAGVVDVKNSDYGDLECKCGSSKFYHTHIATV